MPQLGSLASILPLYSDLGVASLLPAAVGAQKFESSPSMYGWESEAQRVNSLIEPQLSMNLLISGSSANGDSDKLPGRARPERHNSAAHKNMRDWGLGG